MSTRMKMKDIAVCLRCDSRLSRQAWQPPVVQALSPAAKRQKKVPCALCYNLLSSTEHTSILQAIKDAVRFDPTAWSHVQQIRRLTIAVPLSIDTLRHHLSLLHFFEPRDMHRPVPTVKDWLRRDIAHLLMETHPHLTYQEGASASSTDYGVSIDVQVDHPHLAAEMQRLMEEAEIPMQTIRVPAKPRTKKRQVLPGRNVILKALKDKFTPTTLQQRFPLEDAREEAETFAYSASVLTDTLFLGGRYCKYRRTISQTPFFGGPNGTLRCDESVSAFIEKEVLALSGCSDYNMHASGREDMNVRMLGEGRPFYIELTNPAKIRWGKEDLIELADRVHASAKETQEPEEDALPFENKEEAERAKAYRIWTTNWHVVKQYDSNYLWT